MTWRHVEFKFTLDGREHLHRLWEVPEPYGAYDVRCMDGYCSGDDMNAFQRIEDGLRYTMNETRINTPKSPEFEDGGIKA